MLLSSGTSPDGRSSRSCELATTLVHGRVQFHPEFKSRPDRPHPLFREFVATALALRDGDRAAADRRRAQGANVDVQARLDDLSTETAPAT